MRFIHTLCLSLALTVSSTNLTAQAQNGSGEEIDNRHEKNVSRS